MIDTLAKVRIIRTVTVDRKYLYIHLRLNTASAKGEFGDIYFINNLGQTTLIEDDTIILIGFYKNLNNRVLVNYTIEGVPYDMILTIRDLLFNNTTFFERMAFRFFLFNHNIEGFFHGQN